MEDLIKILGGTPIGILIVLMVAALFVLSYLVGKYVTSFMYHQGEDRKEFKDLWGELKQWRQENREKFDLIFSKLEENRNATHKNEVLLAGLNSSKTSKQLSPESE